MELDGLTPGMVTNSPKIDNKNVQDLEKCFNRVLEHLRSRKKRDQATPPSTNQPAVASKDLMQEILPIALYFLDMNPLVSLPAGSSAAPPVGIIPLRSDNCLSPMAKERMRRLSLDVLQALVVNFDRGEVFPLWMIFFPGCSHNPYQLSLCEKLSSPEFDTPSQALLAGVIQAFVDKVGPYLKFVEKKSATLGFTPLYQSLGESLERTHEVLCAYIAGAQDSGKVTTATRLLICVLKNCPYRKLGFDPLRKVLELSLRLLGSENPVVKIAGLNLHLNVILLDSSGTVFDPAAGFQKYFELASPDAAVTDNNVRYVALQNLGQMASNAPGSLAGQVDILTQLVGVNLRDKDDAVVLHTLRVCKWIAKYDPDKESPSDQPRSPFMELWNFLIRPKTFQLVESRSDPNLEALLCDLVSEIGEGTFVSLTHDQRYLCVSYVLTHCGVTSNPPVRSSSFRALGMMLCYKSLRDDASFISDCTGVISDALDAVSGHRDRTTVTCATWALASLSESLLENRSEENYLEFPKSHVLQLVTILVRPHLSVGNVIAQVNLLRCSGSLLRCVDGSYLCGDEEADEELIESVQNVLDFVLANVRAADMMKIRWNACHAAGKIFLNPFIFSWPSGAAWRQTTCTALLQIIQSCPNFKVKISASAALINVEAKEALEDHLGMIRGVLTELEGAENEDVYSAGGGEDGAETKHKLELTDNLALLFCHLLMLSSSPELAEVDAALSRDSVDNLRWVLAQVRRRISPERARVLEEANRTVAGSGGRLLALEQAFS